jgi:hypothetical protein
MEVDAWPKSEADHLDEAGHLDESEAGHLDQVAPSRGWPIQRHADEPRLTVFKEQALAVGRARLVRQARACDLLLHPSAERYLSVCLSVCLSMSIYLSVSILFSICISLCI